jgi:murein DD-endopeptidase MepM/ murein hydrolase activator NlpD
MFRKPVGGPRLVPFGEARRPGDKLANGRPGFRVTQSFGHWDSIFKKVHLAMDIGNFYCGDRVSAMAAGTARRLIDPNGALGIAVYHQNGYRTETWHLRAYKVADGQWVEEGKLIGLVGSTGLDIGGCHCHVACYDPQGRAVDPYPLIRKPNG